MKSLSLPRILFLLVVLLTTTMNARGKEKKKDTKRFKSTIIELTKTGTSEWLLKEAKVGVQMVSNKSQYLISELPDEMMGSTFLQPDSGHEKKWLAGRV